MGFNFHPSSRDGAITIVNLLEMAIKCTLGGVKWRKDNRERRRMARRPFPSLQRLSGKFCWIDKESGGRGRGRRRRELDSPESSTAPDTNEVLIPLLCPSLPPSLHRAAEFPSEAEGGHQRLWMDGECCLHAEFFHRTSCKSVIESF